MASLSDKSGKCIEGFFKNQRFVDDSDNIVCSKCGFKTTCFNTITHIQFMHKRLYPTCKTVCYISCLLYTSIDFISVMFTII